MVYRGAPPEVGGIISVSEDLAGAEVERAAMPARVGLPSEQPALCDKVRNAAHGDAEDCRGFGAGEERVAGRGSIVVRMKGFTVRSFQSFAVMAERDFCSRFAARA